MEKLVPYVTAASIVGSTPKESEDAAEDDKVLDKLVEIADGQTFGKILAAAANEPMLENVKKQIINKSLLQKLVKAGRLELDNKTYRKVEAE